MKRKVFWFAPLVVLVATGLLPAAPVEVQVDRGLTFGKGGDVELKLDLAAPKEGGPYPALVCIHGGGWRVGDRSSLSQTIEAVARRGFVAVSISYRLTSTAKFPAQVEDCKAAVRWLRANAQKYRINPDRIGAVGYSAGGHLACMLGVCGKQDGFEGDGGHPEQSSRVQAVVSFFGPTDFTVRDWPKDVEEKNLIPLTGATFDDHPDLYKKISPITYVTKETPPFLFFHGSKDDRVAPRHSQAMAEKLQAAGVEAKVVVLEGEGHGWKGKKLTETLEQTLSFFDERLKK